jgi:hypothetical protein
LRIRGLQNTAHPNADVPVEICVPKNDTGILAAELKSDRGEMLSSIAGDLMTGSRLVLSPILHVFTYNTTDFFRTNEGNVFDKRGTR